MKTKNLIKIAFSALIIFGAFTSCVNDSDFDTPQVQEEDNDISNGTLLSVKNALLQGFSAGDPSTLIYTYPDNSEVVVAAYIVGDDMAGNFYKKLIVQDSPSNPTFGLELRIDQGSLHTQYNVGRKVYIKMAGLTVGYFDGQQGSAPGYINQSDPTDGVPGVYKLGILGEDYNVDRIPSTTYQNYIVRSSTTEDIVPTTVTTADFNDDHMNTMVKFENTQFLLDQLGRSYAGEATDQYDAARILVSCDSNAQFSLLTSTFSNFKSLTLPEGKGDIKGVMMKTFRERGNAIVLNSHEDINFTDTNRCDPIILDCGLAATAGTNALLVENFDSGMPSGWTNYIEAGTRDWNIFNGTFALSGNSIRMGSHSSGDTTSISWLITPAIDMDAQSGETLEFFTSNSYADGSTLELMFSTDWDGDVANISTATWGILPAATIVDDGEYYRNWVTSNIVDLSCATGTSFYIAFKYTGSGDNNFDGTYELDDFSLKY